MLVQVQVLSPALQNPAKIKRHRVLRNTGCRFALVVGGATRCPEVPSGVAGSYYFGYYRRRRRFERGGER